MYLVQQHKMYFTYNHTYVESPFMYNLGSTKIVNDWISFICSQYCDITGAIAQPQGNALKLICVRPTCIDDFGLSTIAVPLKTSQLGPIFLYRKTQSSFTSRGGRGVGGREGYICMYQVYILQSYKESVTIYELYSVHCTYRTRGI